MCSHSHLYFYSVGGVCVLCHDYSSIILSNRKISVFEHLNNEGGEEHQGDYG